MDPPLHSTLYTLARRNWAAALLASLSIAAATQLRTGAFVFTFFIGTWVVLLLVNALSKSFSMSKLIFSASAALLSCVAIYNIYAWRTKQAVPEAHGLAAAVAEYKGRTGVFPAKLEDAGLGLAKVASTIGARYLSDSKDPFLDYGDAWNPWKRYRYNFSTAQWTVINND